MYSIFLFLRVILSLGMIR